MDMGYRAGTCPSSKPQAANILTLERSFAHHPLPHIRKWWDFLMDTVLIMFPEVRVDFAVVVVQVNLHDSLSNVYSPDTHPNLGMICKTHPRLSILTGPLVQPTPWLLRIGTPPPPPTNPAKFTSLCFSATAGKPTAESRGPIP